MRTETETAIRLAHVAGRKILKVYRNFPQHTRHKSDGSLLTEADLESDHLLREGLSSSAPVLSEEQTPSPERRQWSRFWMIDPLDGTKDFVRRSGDFSVCIALLEANEPTVGVIHAPFLARTWWAERDGGAFVRTPGAERRLTPPPPIPPAPTVLTSRFHRSGGRSDSYMEALGAGCQRRVGSAIKFGRMAEGAAHLYPRLGPTMEWDVAAGACILGEVGLEIVSLETEMPLSFNKEDLHNPPFIVRPRGWGPLPALPAESA